MTESDWFASTDPQKMLDFLRGKTSPRKLRLFAVACCRRIWPLLTDERSRKAVEIAELFADGLENRERLIQARDQVREAKRQFVGPGQVVAWRAAGAAQDATRDTGRSAALNCMAETSRAISVRDTNQCDPAELQQQAAVLRCILGNPIHSVALDPAWQTSTVRQLAEAIYEDRAFERMFVLGDALEDAGCSNDDILEHCREPVSHAKGCWVIDLLLEKK